MRDTIKLGLILMTICLATAGALAYVHGLTGPMIAGAKEKALEDALIRAYPTASSFKAIPGGGKESGSGRAKVDRIYQAFSDGRLKGFVAEVTSRGYGSSIRMLLGLDMEGSIRGLEIVEQSETPGLGSQIVKEDFRKRYSGLRNSDEVRVVKDGGEVQAITGATISSRAVSNGAAAAITAVRAIPMGQ